ncbi:MAG: winged helix-turn-helix domain-containing protein [Planctomycetaceae bacterium]
MSAKKKAGKATKAKANAHATNGKLSQIEAAIKVLGEASKPMNCKAMVEAMGAKGYWSSPNGKTPAATLYAAIHRRLMAMLSRAQTSITGRRLVH